ncbi:hypothetical protein LPJ61_000413 [Coemansia biformis]|uniref:GDP/GTP exchange factor Sec2 N-terminal domain-containing protein n=1 Tax=Coemansia biformis TaxID=1286918 RepID=A0A9W7YHY1_9FUNG|nr:hypothetical protein LPJ61_000413 [Coemansia biformis]
MHRSSSSSSMQSSTMLFAETANGDAPNRRSMGDAQDRPMSSIILVAATDENSGCGRSSFVQRQRETNWFRRQSKSSSLSRQPSQALSTANTLPDQTAHYESLLLKVQDQRNAAMAEAAALQQQLDEQRRAHASDVARLRENLESTTRKLCSEFELRAAAEAKCSRMEFELAELSSNIQLEAQNLVAHERREHTSELERVARKHEELAQLMEMERAQVDSLKHSLERATRELDEEREEAERLRSGMVAFERQMSTLIGPFRGALGGSVSAGDVRQGVLNGRPARTASGERQAQSTAQSFESASAAAAVAAAAEPHITGRIFFGSDAVRADTRLAEFLGFINAASDKEAQSSVFMQRSMREDVEPTLATDTASVSLLSGWSKHRRLIHCVQDTSLALESYTPRIHVGRVLSPACYLCGCSVTRLAGSPLADQKSLAAERRTSGRTHEMYRMRFGDDDTDNKPLCAHCHGRMVTVCSFFDYLKIVRRGLIKRPIADIWLEVNRARLQMWLARSGASADSNLMISAV